MGAKVFKAYLYCGITTTAYWIPNADDRVPLVVVLRVEYIGVSLSTTRGTEFTEGQ